MKKPKTINPQLKISEIAELYPEVIEYLITEYQFYCFGCFIADYETLEEGTKAHGIEGDDFEELMKELNQLINQKIIGET